MIWKTKNKIVKEVGQTMQKTKFAWFPTRLENDTTIWFEKFTQHYVVVRDFRVLSAEYSNFWKKSFATHYFGEH